MREGRGKGAKGRGGKMQTVYKIIPIHYVPSSMT